LALYISKRREKIRVRKTMTRKNDAVPLGPNGHLTFSISTVSLYFFILFYIKNKKGEY
jgi:hypothetical protein